MDGDGTHKKDATIYEAMAKNVLAVVSDVGDFDWSAIIIEDENSASLSNATLAHLPDIGRWYQATGTTPRTRLITKL